MHKWRKKPAFLGHSTVFDAHVTSWGAVRSCSQCAEEIWKRSFLSMVRPTAHTNPSWKRNFSKTLFTSFLCRGETFWKRRYSTENDGVTIIMRFIWPIFLQTQIQNGRWLLRFSFLWRSVDGKHSMRFQSDNSLFIFLQLRWTGP